MKEEESTDTSNMKHTFITNCITLGFAFVQVMMTRWLLALSSFREDWAWLEEHNVLWFFRRLKWYRGREYIHQLRFKRIIEGWA